MSPKARRSVRKRSRPRSITLLPNTAGCYTADDAVRTLRLARELLDGHDLVKLEVLGDPHTLYPNVVETIAAAKTLVADGFKVMVYTSDDPIIANELEEIGCVAVMPLASLIGSGMGILNPWNLQIIIENAKVPVLVDAGVGTASDAAIAMELGCDGVLMNTAIALREESGAHGERDEESRRSRARGLPRGPHAEEAVLRRAELADDGPHRFARIASNGFSKFHAPRERPGAPRHEVPALSSGPRQCSTGFASRPPRK